MHKINSVIVFDLYNLLLVKIYLVLKAVMLLSDNVELFLRGRDI